MVYRYDALGNRTVMTDTNQVSTRYAYDALGRLVTVTENSVRAARDDHETNVTTHYGYDKIGNRTAITNALKLTTTFTYDALSRLVATSDPLTHTTRYGYDAIGNRTVITDANAKITLYAYDTLRRTVAITYTADAKTVTYGYDDAGNRVAMTDTLGTTHYRYDELNRPITITSPLTGTVGYRYNAVGNRRQLIYPSGQVVTYTYDLANRLTDVLDWAGQTTGYGYDDLGQLITTTLPNGVVSVNRYDGAGRLVEIARATAGRRCSAASATGWTRPATGWRSPRRCSSRRPWSARWARRRVCLRSQMPVGWVPWLSGPVAGGEPRGDRGHGLNALRPQALAGMAAAPGDPAGYINRGFVVAWTGGSDLGGSGLALCAIQQRSDGGPWVTWQDCTVAGSAPIHAQRHGAPVRFPEPGSGRGRDDGDVHLADGGLRRRAA